LEWAQVRALVVDGVSKREIARRLGINRRTVARLARSVEPPRYRRAPAGSQLDLFEPVLRRLLEEWPADQGAAGDRGVARRVRLRRLGRSGEAAAARASGSHGA